jgi:hypothetical protein
MFTSPIFFETEIFKKPKVTKPRVTNSKVKKEITLEPKNIQQIDTENE